MDTRVNISIGQPKMVVCPIVYGSIASYIGKRSAEQQSTHRWTIFVRGPNDEDLSTFVSQICFSLHQSFADSLRTIKSPPFEVTETGWGEFEVGIRIFFKDPTEQPIDLLHLLKLYPAVVEKHPNIKKPVISEVYDEIIFTNPKENFLRLLMTYKSKHNNNPSSANIYKEHLTPFDDQSDLQQLTFMEDNILREIDIAKSRLLQLENEVITLLHFQQGDKNTATAQTTNVSGIQLGTLPPLSRTASVECTDTK